MRLQLSPESDTSTEFQDNLANMIKGLPNEEQAQVLLRITAYPPNVMLRYNWFYQKLTVAERSEFLRGIVDENINFSDSLWKKFIKYITEESGKEIVIMWNDFAHNMRLQKILVWTPKWVEWILLRLLRKK